MEDEYYDLALFERVDKGALELSRARALCAAIHQHRDTRFVYAMRTLATTPGYREALVFDLNCEEVPAHNTAGIQYCERLALLIGPDEKDIPEVVALRKSFPLLMHQNAANPGELPSLCLYFGPKPAVLRTWTPQKHLRRIQWWLEASARGDLHPADQPVEQLFFNSKYELVLPWNVGELKADKAYKSVIYRDAERPDGGVTLFMKFVERKAEHVPQSTAHVDLMLPAIVHGPIERDPSTLGALADILAERGVDLAPALRAMLQERLGPGGSPAKDEDSLTAIVLHTPIVRTPGGPPEGYQRRAFLILGGALGLGEALGAYVRSPHDDKYYNDLGSFGKPPTKWRDVQIGAVEVLQENTAAKAREQSGIDDEGPTGVLIGAGSLGATMLGLWGRSGWGRWTAIDNDHIKPHNLSRHPALGQHIGRMKAEVAKELHDRSMSGASTVHAVCGDACNFSNDSIKRAVSSVQLVVDASTTLEYPRFASTQDNVARHACVFLTPDGNSSVLLVEDEGRQMRLRTLEAQYYRAIINADWGRSHLDGNQSHFWSGASCRDLSVKMPYSKLMAHAATLAEQVRLAARQPKAVIRIWHRDASSGAVVTHEADLHAERRIELSEYTLFVDDGVYDRLRAMRASCLPDETGGILLGYYDLNVKAIVVVDAQPAPKDSKGSREGFERGVMGLTEMVAEANRRTAGMVGYIGEWHSHPPGHSARPSTADGIQLAYLAQHMADDGLPAVQLIAGDTDVCVLKASLVA